MFLPTSLRGPYIPAIEASVSFAYVTSFLFQALYMCTKKNINLLTWRLDQRMISTTRMVAPSLNLCQSDIKWEIENFYRSTALLFSANEHLRIKI